MRCRPRTSLVGALALIVSALVTVPLAVGPSETPTPRLVAIGDVHGAYDDLLRILERAGLTNRGGQWKGGSATLVQVGDVLDRGTQVPEVLDLLMSLETMARPEGGRAVVLMGNHEAMNLVGELRDVSPALYAKFTDDQSEARRKEAFEAHRTLAARQRALFREPPPPYQEPDRETWMAAHPPGYLEYRDAIGPGGRYGGWLRQLPAVVKVGDTILVHGGIDPTLAPKRLEDINRQVRREVETFDRIVKMMVGRGLALPFFTLQELFTVARAHVLAARAAGQDPAGPLQTRLAPHDRAQLEELLRIGTWYLINPNSPLWFRGYATWEGRAEASGLPEMLERYGARRVVVGHTMVTAFRVTPRFGRQVFLIDTGMLSSYYAGGRPSALEIRGADATAVYMDGSAALTDTSPEPIP